jgi:hypothetical protein
MKMTRRQFGLAILGGIAALFFGRVLSLFGRSDVASPSSPARARFWKRADHLAG